MASKVSAATTKTEEKGTVILQFGKSNNFQEWRLRQVDLCGKEFGFLANVMKTNVAYVVPAVTVADYMPGVIPQVEAAEGEVAQAAQAALNAASIAVLRLDAEKHRNKEVARLKQNFPKFYAHLWESLSVESKEEVTHHADYVAADLASDPNALWSIIRRTHLTEVHGAVMGPLEIVNLKSKFSSMRQRPNVTLGEFKRDFDIQLSVLAGAGVAVIPQPELAVLFLTKLDPLRYGSMMTQLSNEAALDRPFPATLIRAWTVASSWKTTSPKITASSDMQSVFVCADDVRDDTKGNRGGGRGSGSGRGGRGAGRGASTDAANRGAPTGVSKETRTCRGCLVKGHVYKDCPDNLKSVERPAAMVAAIGEDDEADSPDDNVYVIHRSSDDHTFVMFSDTDVLLDNQAGRSIFKNRALLTDIAEINPFFIGGIDGTSRGLRIKEDGDFEGLGRVGYDGKAAANILSKTQVLDGGCAVSYDQHLDQYHLTGYSRDYIFGRRTLANGRRSSHYSCDMRDSTFVATVAENMRQYTTREVLQAQQARELMCRLGHASSQSTVAMLNAGVFNCKVTPQDVKNADAIFGMSIPALKGKTVKLASAPAPPTVAPRVTQVQQILTADIIFIKKIPFLLGVLVPLGLTLCAVLKSRAVAPVTAAFRQFISATVARNFKIVQLRMDGEGALGPMVEELSHLGIEVDVAGPGQHVPVVERRAQTVKQRFRIYENSLPMVMTRIMIIHCVLFAVSRLNMVPSRMSGTSLSPLEIFTGRKIDSARDLRIGFGDYAQATVANTDNTPTARTQGCIALLPTGNLTGSVRFLCLSTNKVVTRDQFRVLPMPSLAIDYINSLAAEEGYTRGFDPEIADHFPPEDDLATADVALPEMMDIDSRAGAMPLQDPMEPTDAGVIGGTSDSGEYGTSDHTPHSDEQHEGEAETASLEQEAAEANDTVPSQRRDRYRGRGGGLDSLQGLPGPPRSLILLSTTEALCEEIRKQVLRRSDWHDTPFAFTMSVRAALRERGEEATPVILAELKQMLDKGVWHGVHTYNLTRSQRRSIIRSSMFLKDKFLASGAFDRFKARLVAGGNGQDRALYENLSSPTVATTSVFAILAIAATEKRNVVVIDIGGAFLHADLAPTGIDVFMRLDGTMSDMLVKLDPSYRSYREDKGTIVVQLDKALYGCVEASALWYAHLRDTLTRDGFEVNPYDSCVYNKLGASGEQITIGVHVDDLVVTSRNQEDISSLESHLRGTYKELRVNTGDIQDYVGMTFNLEVPGEVVVTMDSCVENILSGCGVETTRATPASSFLFDVRDAPKASVSESAWFHTHVAKLLYLAKRVRPECLTAVAFLATRVAVCDIDDLAKLRRLLGYVRLTRDRGIVLRIGDEMVVRAYIDAAYGVHQDSGKSHTGCSIVLGEAGPLFAKSAKQKIVTKSSTEAELVGLSDTASQAIHLRNFIIAQGYETGPAVIYQDNMSCMALIKRGGPGSERSRHINIRHFWLNEKVAQEEVLIEHLGTADMFANILTKPVQGAQFDRERQGLTNWKA